MVTEIIVPALGESVTTATVARWIKQQGEAVAAESVPAASGRIDWRSGSPCACLEFKTTLLPWHGSDGRCGA